MCVWLFRLSEMQSGNLIREEEEYDSGHTESGRVPTPAVVLEDDDLIHPNHN